MRRRITQGLLGLAALALAGCGGGGGGHPAAPVGSGDSVLDVARANGLDRFVAAVDAAGLTATLSGPGPYTVFAPSDRAFGSRRFGDAEAAKQLVAYHVVPGTFTSDFLDGSSLNYTTLAGKSLSVDGTGSGLKVNGVAVVTADLVADNGVVHVISQVLTPPTCQSRSTRC